MSFQNNELNKCTCRQGLESWHSVTGKGSTECESSVLRSQPHFRANTFKYKLSSASSRVWHPHSFLPPPSTSLSPWAVLHPVVSPWICLQMEEGQLLCSAARVYNGSEPVCNEGLGKRHTHTPEVTLLSLNSNNMAVALLSIGRETSFSVHQVQSWSAKK